METKPAFCVRDMAVPIVIALASWAIALYVLSKLPDSVPVHWGINGQPDRFGSKYEGALVFPSVIVFLAVITYIFPRFDPKKHIGEFKGAYLGLVSLVLTFLLVFQVATALVSLGHKIPMTIFVNGITGLLFAGIGPFLPKLKPNLYAGIRFPWTIANEEVWVRTHRAGAGIFVAAGALCIATGFLPAPWSFYGILGAILVILLGTLIYSILISQAVEKRS